MIAPEPTEQVCAATDAVYAFVAIMSMVVLLRRHARSPWRVGLWSGMLASSAIAAGLGTAYHALVWTPRQVRLLWHPIYFVLGASVALFLTATVHDWRGQRAARRWLLPLLAIGLAFTICARFVSGEFVVFAVYQGLAALLGIVVYTALAIRSHLAGAGWVAVGVGLSLCAAVVSLMKLSPAVIWPFNANAVFHVMQSVATIVLVRGVTLGLDD